MVTTTDERTVSEEKREYYAAVLTDISKFWEECLNFASDVEVKSNASSEASFAAGRIMTSQIDMVLKHLSRSIEKQQAFDKLLFQLLLTIQAAMQRLKSSSGSSSKDQPTEEKNQRMKETIESLVNTNVTMNLSALLSKLKGTMKMLDEMDGAPPSVLLEPFMEQVKIQSYRETKSLDHRIQSAYQHKQKEPIGEKRPSGIEILRTVAYDPSSERCLPKLQDVEDTWDPADEYHHDEDPGYRVTDLYEGDYPVIAFGSSDIQTLEILKCSPYVEAQPIKEEKEPPPLTYETRGARSPDSPPSPTFGTDSPTSNGEEKLEQEINGKMGYDSEITTEQTEIGLLSSESKKGASSVGNGSDRMLQEGHVSTQLAVFDRNNISNRSAWEIEFENGDFTAYLKKQKQIREKDEASCIHAASSDPLFPIRVPSNGLETSKFYILDSFNLKILFERNKTGLQDQKELHLPYETIVGGRYKVERQLGEAAFSRAAQCVDLLTGLRVCMKVIKNDKEYMDQSLDEIILLRYINSNGNGDELNFLKLYDYFYFKEHLIIVTELLQDNLYTVSKYCKDNSIPNYFTLGRLQKITHQLLIAIRFIHSLHLIHCDIKPENILIKDLEKCTVKLIDFGSSRFDDDGYTTYIQSRPYRAPECVLGLPYGHKIDMWSLGCVIAELWAGYVLFQSGSIQGLLARLTGIIGKFPLHMISRGHNVSSLFSDHGYLYQFLPQPPSNGQNRKYRLLWPKNTNLRQRMRTNDKYFVDFLTQLLQIDPTKRLSASAALKHPWLTPGMYVDGLE